MIRVTENFQDADHPRNLSHFICALKRLADEHDLDVDSIEVSPKIHIDSFKTELKVGTVEDAEIS